MGGIFHKTEEELEAETIAFWRRAARLPWASIVACLIGVFVVWRLGWLWSFGFVVVAVWLAWSYRDSPLGQWLRARLWDRLFVRPSQTLPFRPLGEFDPIDGPRELEQINWPVPPRNDEHAWSRIEYARVGKLLEGMSRDAEGDGWHERRKLVLYHAQLLDALHQAGDDPLKTQAAPPLAAFAAVGGSGSPRSGILAALVSGLRAWQLYALGALAAFGGWQFARAEVTASKLREVRQERAAWAGYAHDLEKAAKQDAKAAARDVARLAQEQKFSADHLESERRRNQRLARDLRRIENETRATTGVDVAVGLRILGQPADSGEGPAPADPPTTGPELQPGMPPESGAAPGV